MLRSLSLLLLHSSLRSRPTQSRLLFSTAAAAATSIPHSSVPNGRAHGTVSAVLEIVGPIELLFPTSEARLYVRLVRRCARDALAAGAAAAHAHVVKRGFASDVLVSNALQDSYAKGGSLAAGRQLFDEMPHRDVVSWCTVIAAHATRRLFVKAIEIFKELLLSDQVKPNRFVISSVLNACARPAPNDQLESLARDPRRARDWVRHNVTANLNAGVDVRYVAVGNEPFLKSYNGSCINITFPALKNMQRALDEAGFGQRIKVVVPLNADIYSSPENKPVPSAGSFRKDINALMIDIVNFLHVNDAPFVVNIYPFLSLYQNPNFPLNFSFFDGATKPVYDQGMVYSNVFDANFDTLVWSLRKAGVPDMRIIVGEVGWPTDGDKNANIKYAQRFYSGFLKKMAKNVGTPLRPGHMEVYLFALIDENQKSVLPGRFERHWGLFTYDGKPKFSMDLSGNGKGDDLAEVKGVQYLPSQWCVFNKDAKDKYKDLPASVNYACSNADCTPLGYGSSCNGLSHDGNISYAFNIYFQTMDQDVRACSFGGLAKITMTNASQGGCLFPVQILSVSGRVAPQFFFAYILGSVSLCIQYTIDRTMEGQK